MATVRIQVRRGTASQWTSANPTLAAGELGVESDTNLFKFGNGSTTWTALAYANNSDVAIGEISQDAINTALTMGAGLTKTYNDGANTITITVDSSVVALKSYVDSAVSTHEADTTNVHGIADTAALATKVYADSAVSTHEADTTNVHGIADTAALATKVYADTALSTHEVDTTSVHGITNSADIVYLTGAQTLSGKTLNNVILSGSPTAPTQSADDNSTKVATTAYVQAELADLIGAAPALLNTLSELSDALGDNENYAAAMTATITGINNTIGTKLATATFTAHEIDTTAVHGISDTANLVYTADARLSDTRTPTVGSVVAASMAVDSVVTASLANSSVTGPKIAALSVTEAKLADDSVTAAKIAAGAVGTSEVADLAVTSGKIATDAVGSNHIAAAAVGTSELADDSVTAAKIAASAVGTSEINALAVTEAKIADLNVTTAKINDSAVTEGKIAALSVTTGKIADSAVTSGKIADGTIVDADVNASAAIAQSKISGLTADLALKAPIASPTFTGTVTLPAGTVTSGMIFDGTIVDADVNASAAIAQSKISGLTADLALKAPIASPTFTGTVSGITKSMVDLGSVDNTADSAKPVSTAAQTALNLKAPLASPTFTGTVTIPSGASISGFALLASPGLTGVPTAPTAAAATNTTQVATTAYVRGEVAALVNSAGATLDTLGEIATALGNDANLSTTLTTSIATKAPIASPTFTGTVTIPAGASISGFAPLASPTFTGTVTLPAGTVTSGMILDGTIVDADVNASAAIAQSKISGLTADLAAKAPLASPTFTGTVTVAASGVAFTDGTQTKEGVPSRTVIGTTISAAYNLSTGGLGLRDQLIPISGTQAITVPLNATTAYPIGTSISFYQASGTGANFVFVGGVTPLATPGQTLRATSSSATLTKVATDTWLLAGDLKA